MLFAVFSGYERGLGHWALLGYIAIVAGAAGIGIQASLFLSVARPFRFRNILWATWAALLISMFLPLLL